MATNQESIQLAVRAQSGTALTYNEDWHALFDADGIPAGTFNGRMLAWLNAELDADGDTSAPYPVLMQAMEVYAQRAGFANWSAMNALL